MGRPLCFWVGIGEEAGCSRPYKGDGEGAAEFKNWLAQRLE